MDSVNQRILARLAPNSAAIGIMAENMYILSAVHSEKFTGSTYIALLLNQVADSGVALPPMKQ